MVIRSDPALAVIHGRAGVLRVARWMAFTDGLVVIWAVVGAHILRFSSLPILGEALQTTSSLELEYSWVSAGVVVLWLAALHGHNAYDPRMFGHGTQEYRAVVTGTWRLFATLAIISYLSKIELARGYVLIAFPAGLLALLVTRRLWRTWLGARRSRGEYADRVLPGRCSRPR